MRRTGGEGLPPWKRPDDVPTAAGFLYPAAVLDACSRKSGQGSEYTSLTSGGRCREVGVRHSMGSVGDAYDNAMSESFFSTLGCELLLRRRLATQAEAKIVCFSYIEGFYNPVGLHSAIGYQ